MKKFLMAIMSVLTFIALSGCGSDDKNDKKDEPKACDCSCCPHDDDGTCDHCGGDDCKCDDGCCDDGACPADGCADGSCPSDGGCSDSKLVFSQTVQPWELPNMNASGATYRSSDFTNGIFVVENYFVNCPYCNDNAENVHAMQQEYASNPQVQFLDVGIDRTDRQYEQWISRHSPVHPVLKDDSRVLTNQLGTTGFPSAYLIDCHMNVVYKTTGVWDDGTKLEIKAKIQELMDVPCYLTVADKN